MQKFLNDFMAVTDYRFAKTLIVILIALISQKIIKILITNSFKYTLESKYKKNRKVDNERRVKTISSIINAIIAVSVWFVAFIVILKIFKVNIGVVLASAGFIGAALAFGTQSFLKDFISGLFIIIENQYRIDDYVEFNDIYGKIEKISIRTTTIRDDNGSLHYIPNGSISIITNFSKGLITISEQLDIKSNYSIDSLENNLKNITNYVNKDVNLNKYIKEGPYLDAVIKASKDLTTVSISFVTTATKKTKASSIFWIMIKKENIPLA